MIRKLGSWLGWLGCLSVVGLGSCAWGQTVGQAKDGPAVFNQVQTRTTILSRIAEGTQVKKGDVVCELDPEPIQLARQAQAIVVKSAESAYQIAKLAREAAENEATEYSQAIHKMDRETVLGEIALAESELKRAEDRLNWSDRRLSQGTASVGQNITEKLTLQRAKFALEKAQTRRQVLEKFTKPRMLKQLNLEGERARAEELRLQAKWELERAKLAVMDRQLLACKVKAPVDGKVLYAPLIEPGAVVKGGELLFRVITGKTESR